jgi:ketosteroid isomerase-like protein
MWREAFGDFRIEVDEVIDAGEHVIVMAITLGTGDESGAPVSAPRFPHVWTVRGGRVVRMEMFMSKDEALEAAGLSE